MIVKSQQNRIELVTRPVVFPPLASFTLVLIPRPRAATTIRLFATTALVQGNVLNLGHKSVVADRRDDFARPAKEGREKIKSKTYLFTGARRADSC